MDILKDLAAAVSGFGLYMVFTHHKYQKKRIPRIRIGKLQILPNLRIRFKRGTVRLHHWIILSAILGFLNHDAPGIGNLILVKLFALGGVIQGLTFRDRFNIFWKKPVGKLRYYPKISVVIPAYNEEKFIGKTLASLRRQNYPRKFEIIVVDNGSGDKTAKIAKKYGAKIVYEAQKGIARARQAGFEKAYGKIIVSTDADCILPKDWLSRFAAEFAKRPQAVAISGMCDFYDGGRFLKTMAWIFNYQLFRIFRLHTGANMAVKKEAFAKIDGFSTSLPFGEDSNLFSRLKKFGRVYRLSSFKVATSARRFNNLGFWGGLWDYSFNSLKFQFNKSAKVDFRAGSEIPRLGFLPRLAISTFITAITLAFLFGGIFEIKPVRASVIKRGRHARYSFQQTVNHSVYNIKHQISQVDYAIDHFHHTPHVPPK